ncbi:glutamine amidotransferase [Rhodopirellula sp. JC639]|uniref:glutamine amidotransferase n=1 Tax=Stieleria mannarensis TaxID=2755585 RepID=UPI0016035A92|nr:glutamine amidotransferase [Rhodopirellula sp. JC639]
MILWDPLYPMPVYLGIATVIVALVWIARRISVSPKTRRPILLGMRASVLIALAVLLLNPIERRETVMPPRRPAVALLVDCSQSMGLGQGQSRLDQLKQTIGTVTRNVQRKRDIDLPMFRFGSRLAKVPGLTELTAADDRSLLSDALKRLSSRVADDRTQAVVLFSDGAVDQSDQLEDLATAYRKLGIPVHAMLPDQGDLRGDVAITELSLPSRVSKGDRATVRALIESRGFENERVVVSIRPDNRPRSPPLASLPITLREGTTSCELVVTADPALGELAIDVPIQTGEAVDTNNRVPFRLIDKDRTLNVLYMEGTSAAESRWLQDALHADSDIKCVAMTVDNQHAQRPRLQRTDDPYRGFPSTRAELFQYDVVICSDISFRAFTPEQIDWTVELVDQRGGGFVMIGGFTSFGAGGWDRTPWEGMIPFDMSGRRDYLNQGFRVAVPPQTQSHPIWNLLDDPRRNRKALDAMPPFSGTNLISRVKPAATLLGQTRTPLARVGIMPVFACESYGRGRTFAMSTDTTYGWGARFEREWGEGDNRYYQKFWRNVVRWLAENSQASQNRLVLRADQVIYSPDESIELVVQAFDDSFVPTTNYRLTTRLVAELEPTATAADNPAASSSMSVTMNPQPASRQYTVTIPARLAAASDDRSSPMQTAHLVVDAWLGNQKIATESLQLQLLHRSTEWLHPQANPERLQRVVDAGGGQMVSSPLELQALLESLDIAPGEVLIHKLPAWDHWMLWTMLLAVLAIDWILRRRGTGPATQRP